MTRPCAFCGDPTERVYSVDMDLPGVPLCSYLCLHLWFDREMRKRILGSPPSPRENSGLLI